MRRVITLLTDFGTQDYFVASMKGVILSIVNDVHIVDISHDVPPQDIKRAAMILWACYKYFPRGTIHVVVVDPGVGTARKPLLIVTRNYFFVGPDNGVLVPAAEDDGIIEVYEIDPEKVSRGRISTTFHGRDIFAPAAAYLALGLSPEDIGHRCSTYVKLELEKPRKISENEYEAQVVYIDRFGNVYTNMREEHLAKRPRKVTVRLPDGRTVEMPFVRAYGDVEPGKELALINSEGFLELSINYGNFSNKYGLKPLDRVVIKVE